MKSVCYVWLSAIYNNDDVERFTLKVKVVTGCEEVCLYTVGMSTDSWMQEKLLY